MQNHWLYKKNIEKLSTEEKQEIFIQVQKKIDKKQRQKRIRMYLSAFTVLLSISYSGACEPADQGI